MEWGSKANSELDCPVKVWAGLGAFRLNAGAEVSQKENHTFFLFVIITLMPACYLALHFPVAQRKDFVPELVQEAEWLLVASTACSIWLLSGQKQEKPLAWSLSSVMLAGHRSRDNSEGQGPSAWTPRCFLCCTISYTRAPSWM